MRMSVLIFVLTVVCFNIPTSAHAKIAVSRGTIVSIGVIEDGKNGVFFGSIVFERGSLRDRTPDKKRDLVTANITKNTTLSGGRNRGGLKFSDLKPGMAIVICIAGSRAGPDQEWQVRSIQVIALDELLRP
jgi:hypothetical protein